MVTLAKVGTSISACLANTYRKQGNRLVFRNGMNLNELAWEMWERLGFKEIDPSVLSRVVNGKRCFTPKQLQIFAQILNLPSGESLDLQTEYCRETLIEIGVEEELVSSLLYQTDRLEEGVNLVEEARAHDALDLASLLATQIENQISSKIKAINSTKTKKKLYDILGQLLVKKGWLVIEHCHPNRLLPVISPLPPLFEIVYYVTKNPQYKGLALAHTSRILFHQGKYCQSLEQDFLALPYLQNPEALSWIYSRLSVNPAMLENGHKISSILEKINANFPIPSSQHQQTPADKVAINENFLRHRRLSGSYTLAQKPRLARNHLDTAWGIYSRHLAPNEGNFKHRARIELYHSENYFHYRFKTAIGPSDQMREETQKLVNLFGYHQYTVDPGPPSLSQQL